MVSITNSNATEISGERDIPENTATPPQNIETPTSNLNDSSLSKNALKRQLKRQRWEDGKEARKEYKKAKLKQKKDELKANGKPLPKKSKVFVEGQNDSGVRVVIDCGFDELMTDKVCFIMFSSVILGNYQYVIATDKVPC
jgi:hypothetical protein